MYSHLAIATDFSKISETLVDKIDEFRRLGAQKLTLVHVQEVSYPISAMATDSTVYEEKLQEVFDRLSARGWQVETEFERGRPAVRIVDVARRVDADLLVLGNKGHGAIGEVLLGSVATEVLERADRPVFLFCDEADDRGAALFGQEIVHPTDFSTAADDALAEASKMAVSLELPVVLFHVLRGSDKRNEQVREDRHEALEDRSRRLTQAGVSDVTATVEEGAARRIVIDKLAQHPDALCVMGTCGRGKVGDFVLGGVTRAAARKGGHHMLVVPELSE